MASVFKSAMFILIPAGGAGTRCGGDVKKQFLKLGGNSLLRRTLMVFLALPPVKQIVVALPEGDLPQVARELDCERVTCVAGGLNRAASVKNALDALGYAADDDAVLVHDAVRPLVTVELIIRVYDAVMTHGAAVPVLPMADTVKEIHDGCVIKTVDRTLMARAQTPQGARCGLLRQAYAKYGGDLNSVTDESMLLESAGIKVVTVVGDPANIKVTTPFDLKMAEALRTLS